MLELTSLTVTFASLLIIAGIVAYVGANLAVLFHALPAYRRQRRPGFLLLTISAALGLFVTVWDWTGGRTAMGQSEAYWLWCLRQVLTIADALCYAVGVLLVLRLLDPQAPTPRLRDHAAEPPPPEHA